MEKPPKPTTCAEAGSRGGSSGTGDKKKRSSEHYQRAGQLGAAKRWGKTEVPKVKKPKKEKPE